VAVPRQSAVWDERRNSSRVTPPGPAAAADARERLDSFRAQQPQLAAWVEAGAPPIRSDDEHRRWFGEPYAAPARRSRR
jgi:hypothetical protein